MSFSPKHFTEYGGRKSVNVFGSLIAGAPRVMYLGENMIEPILNV